MPPLYTITFLLPATLLEAAAACMPVTSRMGICINNAASFHADNIYRILFFKQAKHPFCLAVPAGTASNILLHDAVLPLFNHPQYAVREKKPEVILINEGTNTGINQSMIEAFQGKAQAQGWAGVHVINFFKTPYGTQRDEVFSLAISSVAELKTFFSENPLADISAMAGAHFIIQVDDVSLIPFVQTEFVKIEEAVLEKNPKVYHVYTQLMRITKDLQETKEQLQFSNKQLDSLKRYNAILKSEDQTRRILEFYHSQYEVLPLWYKQFGHIIKVLTGKRSLKSLFDDASKKETP